MVESIIVGQVRGAFYATKRIILGFLWLLVDWIDVHYEGWRRVFGCFVIRMDAMPRETRPLYLSKGVRCRMPVVDANNVGQGKREASARHQPQNQIFPEGGPDSGGRHAFWLRAGVGRSMDRRSMR